MNNFQPIHLYKKSVQIVFLLVFIPIFGQEGLGLFLNSSEHTIMSETLNEKRKYIVSLPNSYNSGITNYPVMLVLDGDYHVHSASTTLEVMSKEGQIPEMIIVAVVTDENRTRDLTPTKSLIGYDRKDNSKWQKNSGGGKQFLEFIETELFPEIAKNFRTKNYNIFVGHSLGGLSAAESYLTSTLFNAYIAIDPALFWDDNYIIEKINSLSLRLTEKKRFYFSGASNYNDTTQKIDRMRTSHELFYASLKNAGMSSQNVKFQILENEDHNSAPLVSLYYGLKFIFKGFTMESIHSKTIDDIVAHYNKLSNNLGVSFLPPENVINNVAWSRFNSNHHDEAFEFFKMNVKNYPLSHMVHEMIGYAYNNSGRSKEAITHFKKSVGLNKNQNEVKRINELIDRLEKQK
ncbi:alpha/beta hydrolase-fold protein [Tamlana sp. 2201CG12-4]|uniref:alpha/beta hydrolase-fold protein n=1 Tax=Tamlana sp. 2201CG12-4 TaxID=3112582 RepID=UPI002DB6AB05|nr:alpha/beta hydrolase-fold protein [Tamlana sp. 2201CG12-4]MEC3907634.1 alpha/beta hydrolase-fold protein [Tamlana sp. 2201CG12-4]